MFPLRDTIRSRSFPIATYGLIAINTLIFIFEASLGQNRFSTLLEYYGLVPTRITLNSPLTVVTLFTSMFLHGGWFHLISNMWTLFIFGDNVEDRMGSIRFVVFYVLAGVISGLTYTLVTITAYGASSLQSRIPTVGASGAIAGVLGAYLILFPRARVLTFVPLFIVPWTVEIPAVIYLGIWFFTQVSSGLLSLGAYGTFVNIAWWAHIGGFIVGMLIVRFFTRRPPRYVVEQLDEYPPW
jgi:membrane associated rhomboid family serine protease